MPGGKRKALKKLLKAEQSKAAPLPVYPVEELDIDAILAAGEEERDEPQEGAHARTPSPASAQAQAQATNTTTQPEGEKKSSKQRFAERQVRFL